MPCCPRRLFAIRFPAILYLLIVFAAFPVYADAAQDNSLTQQLVTAAKDLPRLHSVLVAHDGDTIVAESIKGADLDQPVNIKSLSKTVLALLVGIAIDRELIDGVDQPIVELLGDRVPDDATVGVETVTVGHLLSLQAGLARTSGRNYGRWVVSDNWVDHVLTRPFVADPGGRMLYSTGSSHLLSAALTEVSGKSTLTLARDWLADPLDVTIPAWPRDPQGIYFGGNDMRLSPRALLKIGEVYRQGGEYNGERIVAASWVKTSWQGRGRSAFTDDPYGYGWFLLELAGEQAYYGRGFGGQLIYVVPSLQLTVVMTSNPNPPSPGSRYLRQLHQLMEEIIIPRIRTN